MSFTQLTTTFRNKWKQYTLIVILFLGFVVVLCLYYPVGVDWEYSYNVDNLDEWRDPYSHSAFEGVPWVFFLLPHVFLSLEWGNVINFVIHLLVIILIIRKYKGGGVAILLTFTSPMFFDLARTNNIDWIPLLAFLLPAQWGLPLLLSKPQVLGGAAIIWWRKAKFRINIVIPTVLIALVSFAIWGMWFTESASSEIINSAWNFSPWPIMIPLGLYILYKGFRVEDEVIAAGATPFLVPYFAPYSLVGLMALLSSRYPRIAFYVYVAFWSFVIVEARRINLMG